MQTTRWKVGDRIGYEAGDSYELGTIVEVTERAPQADNLYGIKWDDGFDDGEGNIFPEWELNDLDEINV